MENVLINGVKWATHNIGSRGIFTSKLEDFGEYYTPENAKKSCPFGYRVPTINEIGLLLDTSKVTNESTVQNGVNGRRFTDIATGNSIFLPAAGCRSTGGMLLGKGTDGFYWSSSKDNSIYGYIYFLPFKIRDTDVYVGSYPERTELSVRCVADVMEVKLVEKIIREVIEAIKKVFRTDYLVDQENYEDVIVFDLTDTNEYRRDLNFVVSLKEKTIEFMISKEIMIKNNIAVEEFASILFRKFSTGFKYREIGVPNDPILTSCEFLVNLKSDDELKTIINS